MLVEKTQDSGSGKTMPDRTDENVPAMRRVEPEYHAFADNQKVCFRATDGNSVRRQPAPELRAGIRHFQASCPMLSIRQSSLATLKSDPAGFVLP